MVGRRGAVPHTAFWLRPLPGGACALVLFALMLGQIWKEWRRIPRDAWVGPRCVNPSLSVGHRCSLFLRTGSRGALIEHGVWLGRLGAAVRSSERVNDALLR